MVARRAASSIVNGKLSSAMTDCPAAQMKSRQIVETGLLHDRQGVFVCRWHGGAHGGDASRLRPNMTILQSSGELTMATDSSAPSRSDIQSRWTVARTELEWL